MKNIVVVGSQWGDEGKGKIVDWLSEQADVVVRFQGGHLKHNNVIDILINTKDIKIFKSERHKTKNTHGTGCTLSSSVTTFLSCGKTVKNSCELGIKYVNSAIKSNPKYGKGHGPINHLTSLKVNRKF